MREHEMTRREFVENTAAAVAGASVGAGLVGAPAAAAAPADAARTRS